LAAHTAKKQYFHIEYAMVFLPPHVVQYLEQMV